MSKPDAPSNEVFKGIESIEDKTLVLLAGINDVAEGKSKQFINRLINLLSILSLTNKIVVSTIPRRFDLPRLSSINLEIDKTNLILCKLVREFKNVSLLDTSSIPRHHFTPHGFHLNWAGKIELLHRIVSLLKLQRSKKHQQMKPNITDFCPNPLN